MLKPSVAMSYILQVIILRIFPNCAFINSMWKKFLPIAVLKPTFNQL
jgi:hypothetical protein